MILTKQSTLDERQFSNLINYINITKELIDTEGINNVSIRKIALKAGLHNSTLYLYFEDLDELIMYASLKYFKEYRTVLSQASRQNLNPVNNFIFIWNAFFDAVFDKPHIFRNFFFGKKSENLHKIIDNYYHIFPKEKEMFSEIIAEMYFGKNLTARSLMILKPLIYDSGSQVNENNIDMINEIIVAVCKYKLELKCSDSSIDSEQLKQEAMKAICYVCGI